MIICGYEHGIHDIRTFIRYVTARLRQQQREEAYRIFVTDALKAISENTANAGRSAMSKRYYDLINARPEANSRTAEEIIKEIEKNTGIKAVRK